MRTRAVPCKQCANRCYVKVSLDESGTVVSAKRSCSMGSHVIARPAGSEIPQRNSCKGESRLIGLDEDVIVDLILQES